MLVKDILGHWSYTCFVGPSTDCMTPVSGSTVFGFQTPKRRGGLAEAGKCLLNGDCVLTQCPLNWLN